MGRWRNLHKSLPRTGFVLGMTLLLTGCPELELASKVQVKHFKGRSLSHVRGKKEKHHSLRLSHKRYRKAYKKHYRPYLRIEFERPGKFDLKKLGVSLNGIRARHPRYFNLSRYGFWKEEGKVWAFYLDLSELKFGSKYSLHKRLAHLYRYRRLPKLGVHCKWRVKRSKVAYKYKKKKKRYKRRRYSRPESPKITKVTPEKKKIEGRDITFHFESQSKYPVRFECSLNRRHFRPCESPKTYTNLHHGRKRFRVRAVDRRGRRSHAARHKFKVLYTDKLLVNITKVDPESSPTLSSKIAVAFTVEGKDRRYLHLMKKLRRFKFFAEHTLVFQDYWKRRVNRLLKKINRLKQKTTYCRLDGGEYKECQSPVTYEGLGAGPHTIDIIARSHGAQSAPASYSWIIDGAPPVVRFDETPDAETNSTQATFEFSSSEGATFSCALAGDESYASCESPHTLKNLAEGTHAFYVIAEDSAGNRSEPIEYVWKIDLTAPTLLFTSIEPAQSPTANTDKTLNFEASEDSHFYCEHNGTVLTDCVSPLSLSNLSDGDHDVTIIATDSVGNESSALTHSWTVDSALPEVVLTRTAPLADLSNSSQASFEFHANEESHFECALNGTVVDSCESPLSFDDLSEGTHEFQVTATDGAGNQSTESSQWSVDLTAPEVAITQAVPSDSPTDLQSMELSFEANEAANFDCELDGNGFSSCTSPFIANFLADGDHSVLVRATDAAGNVSETVSYDWTISTLVEVSLVSVEPASSPVSSQSISFTFTSPQTSEFRCSLDGSEYTSCSSPASYSDLSDGAHSFSVKAVNGPNESEPANYEWIIDTTAPEVSLGVPVPAENPTASTTLSLSFTANETSTFYCQIDGGAFALCESPYQVNDLAEGSHEIGVYARDLSGNDSSVSIYSWDIDLVGPTVSINAVTPSENPTSSRSISVAFSASEAATFYCKLDNGAASECVSPFSATDLAEGNHTVSIYAEDSVGNVGATVSYPWSIDLTGPTIAIENPIPAENPTASGSLTVNLVGDASAFFCQLNGGGFSACSSNHQVTDLTDGTHTIEAYGKDELGNSGPVVSYSWTIDQTAPTVTLGTATPPENVTADPNLSLPFTSNEPSTFYCQLDGAGFQVCTSPYNVVVGNGEHSIDVYAEDGVGNRSATVSYVWSVDHTPPSLTLGTASPAHSPTASTTMSLAFSAGGATAFYCQLDGGGYSACSSPFVVSGLNDGSHTIDVYAEDSVGNQSAPESYSWEVDTTPLAVSNVSIQEITSTSVTIAWDSNIPATSQIIYGIGANLDEQTAEDPNYVTSHQQQANGLNTFTFYSFKVRSVDRDGRVSESPTYTFRTKKP